MAARRGRGPEVSRKYLVITPCRDEAEHLPTTILTMARQTVLPAKWVIVDDASTDDTPCILDEAVAKYPFIDVVRREHWGQRSVGPGVIEAFDAGLDQVNLDEYEYLCKLDADLELPSRYFETLMRKMEAQPRLGSCSGKPYYVDEHTGRQVLERMGNEMSVGASKFYRRECFEQIGGFERAVMWDGIDCHRCRMLGWIAAGYDEPEVRFRHLRPMGSSGRGVLRGRTRHGYGQYFMGTGLMYITASAVFRLATPPRVIGALAMWWGYVWSMLRRRRRLDDPGFRRFLRRYQWACLIRGKKKATERLNATQVAKWQAERKARSISRYENTPEPVATN